jgi:origin recognition complex subunit 5
MLVCLQTLCNICAIFIVEAAGTETLNSIATTANPVYIHFPVYTKPQMVQILCLDCPSSDNKALYRKFVNYLFDSFHHSCGQDLLELQHLTQSLVWYR